MFRAVEQRREMVEEAREVVFISGDGGFWAADGIHPAAHLSVRTRFSENSRPSSRRNHERVDSRTLRFPSIDRELIDRASRELSRVSREILSALSIKEPKVRAGKLLKSPTTRNPPKWSLQLVFKLLRMPSPPEQPNLMGFSPVTFSRFLGGQGVVNNALAARIQNAPYLSNVNQILADVEPPQAERVTKELECKVTAHVSLPIKHDKTTEISVDSLEIDRRELFSQLDC
jgi:hypothetical protein